MRVGNVPVTNRFFWALIGGVGCMIVLSLLLNYTSLGREMRALANNFALARVIGIRVDRVQGMTWLLVGGLAGVAGALWGLSTAVNPLTGWLTILSVFAAAILGGLSSFPGTIIGAYIVGLSENTLMQILNHFFGLGFNFKPAIPFIIIIIVLLLRPQGLTDLLPTQRNLTR
ncbi:MAG: branched-chain amino acid ABC transporter permease [Chloroflexi bacterium]|nr:MAG: branched-chain amino acid ABC transporter permease [Chloroflexota bacterium]